MNPEMEKQLEAFTVGLQHLVDFCAAHPELEGTAVLSNSDGACIVLHDAALAGKVLGTSGWTRNLPIYGNDLDWERRIDGVRLLLLRAEPIPRPETGSPVSPNAFPLALEDMAQ